MAPKIRVRIPHSLMGVKPTQRLRRLCFRKSSRSQAKSFVHGRVLGIGLAWRSFGPALMDPPVHAGGFFDSEAIDNSTVLQRRPFSKGPIVAIVDSSHCGT
jgi:hypothetical protein